MAHTLNLVRSQRDGTEFQYGLPLRLTKLPPSVDLRKGCSPVVDQGDLGSCSANAIVSGLREFMLLRSKASLVRLSRLFVYYEERVAEGTVSEDAGATTLKDGLACLLHLGVCREDLDPYDISTFQIAPSPKAMDDAANYKIAQYLETKDLAGVKACLAQGYPLVAGMEVFEQMESEEAARTGVVRVPPPSANSLGGHAVTIVGYTDTPRWQPGYWKGGGWLLLRNSWGAGWGMQGYFRVAYQYLLNGLMWDLWTAR